MFFHGFLMFFPCFPIKIAIFAPFLQGMPPAPASRFLSRQGGDSVPGGAVPLRGRGQVIIISPLYIRIYSQGTPVSSKNLLTDGAKTHFPHFSETYL
jgi:hypothetical protein